MQNWVQGATQKHQRGVRSWFLMWKDPPNSNWQLPGLQPNRSKLAVVANCAQLLGGFITHAGADMESKDMAVTMGGTKGAALPEGFPLNYVLTKLFQGYSKNEVRRQCELARRVSLVCSEWAEIMRSWLSGGQSFEHVLGWSRLG